MTDDILDYAAYIDTAMRGVVRDILREVEKSGLPGAHHFFISYRTDYPGVEMSPALRSKYPKEITIVLQHQFWDMDVGDNAFSVSLSFSNVPEKLVIPFAALVGFADPSTKFGLKFHHHTSVEPLKSREDDALSYTEVATDGAKESAEIIALDAFRKK